MSDWTSGYIADIGYTFGYYTELNPLAAKLAFLNAGLVPPAAGTICELGFGQGVSANIHAAAQAGSQVWATDFNPAHAGFAQSLAAASGSGARLFDQSFAEFCAREDLPDFDCIGIHGIWSWISDENRRVIVDFIRRKMKVGGVLYMSYNTQPGWAAMVPLRDLLTEHAEVMGSSGQGMVPRIDGALNFAERLFAASPAYALANPHVSERLRKLQGQDRNYLAHEYFNRDWQPMSFSRMAEWLAPTKLGYACSANYLDHIDLLNLSAAQRELLKAIPDPMFRETVRDFCVNQQFRRDYWVKGGRRMNSLEQREAVGAQRVILRTPRSEVVLTVTGCQGEGALDEGVYGSVLDLLADHQPRTLAAIVEGVAGNAFFPQVVQAVMVLTGKGCLSAVQDEAATARAKPHCDRLNTYLLDRARGSGEVNVLASPVTGGGVRVDRFQQLFLLARSQGKVAPREWAAFAWEILASQGQKLVKEGKPLATAAENVADLTSKASVFAEKQVSILQAMQIA